MNYIEFPKIQNRRKNPLDDIVFSSRVRISRNIESLRFPLFLDETTLSDLEEKVANEIKKIVKDICFQRIEALTNNELMSYLTNKVITEEFIRNGRLFCYQRNGDWVLLFNEEDHIKLFSIETGYNVRQIYQRLNNFLVLLEENIDFAFDEEFGYLTSSILNVGTALRISVLVNLSGIFYAGKIEELKSSLKEMSYNIQPFYSSDVPLYYLYNTYSLGISEEEMTEEIENNLLKILKMEYRFREDVIYNKKDEVKKIVEKFFNLNKINKLYYKDFLEYILIVDLLNKSTLYVDDINYIRNLIFIAQDDYLKFKYQLDEDEMSEMRIFLIRKIIKQLKYRKAYI